MTRLIFVFATLCLPALSYSQGYFAKLTKADNPISGSINHFSIGGKNYILSGEYCISAGVEDCVRILEIMPDGSTVYVKDIDRFRMYSRSVVSGDSIVTMVGQTLDSTVTLIKFNAALEEIDRETYNTGTNVWISGMIEYDQFYVLMTYAIGLSPYNLGQIYWIRKSDLGLDAFVQSPDFEEFIFPDAEVDANNNLRIFGQKRISDTEYHQYILTYNNQKELIQTVLSPLQGWIPYAQFNVFSDGSMVFGAVQGNTLYYITETGALIGSVQLDKAFLVPVSPQYLFQMIKTNDGGLMMCGQFNNQKKAGFILKVSESREVVWGRIYSIDNAYQVWIKEIQELPNEDILLIGKANFTTAPLAPFDDRYWVLKTDKYGCVLPGCINGSVATEEIPLAQKPSLSVQGNPVRDGLLRYTIHDFNPGMRILVCDALGRILLEEDAAEQHAIPLPGYANGVYFVALKEQGRVVETVRFCMLR